MRVRGAGGGNGRRRSREGEGQGEQAAPKCIADRRGSPPSGPHRKGRWKAGGRRWAAPQVRAVTLHGEGKRTEPDPGSRGEGSRSNEWRAAGYW